MAEAHPLDTYFQFSTVTSRTPSGAFGEVTFPTLTEAGGAAFKLPAGTKVALKTFTRPDTTPEDVLSEFNALKRAALAAGRHLPAVYGRLSRTNKPGTKHALVMEAVEGRTLAETDGVDIPTLAACMVKVIAALHAQDLVHGDIKPANIMVRPDGTLVFVDFGVSCLASNASEGIQACLRPDGAMRMGTVEFNHAFLNFIMANMQTITKPGGSGAGDTRNLVLKQSRSHIKAVAEAGLDSLASTVARFGDWWGVALTVYHVWARQGKSGLTSAFPLELKDGMLTLFGEERARLATQVAAHVCRGLTSALGKDHLLALVSRVDVVSVFETKDLLFMLAAGLAPGGDLKTTLNSLGRDACFEVEDRPPSTTSSVTLSEASTRGTPSPPLFDNPSKSPSENPFARNAKTPFKPKPKRETSDNPFARKTRNPFRK